MDESEIFGAAVITAFIILIIIIPLLYGVWEYKNDWSYRTRLLDEVRNSYQKVSSVLGFPDKKSLDNNDKPPGETGGMNGNWR